MSEHFDKESRKSWRRSGNPTMEDLKLGCLQRIADATEAMAKNHDELVRQRDLARAEADFWRREAEAMRRRVSSLRGVVTRMKRAAAAQQGGRGDG